MFRKLPVSCLPRHIPTKIVHDVTELGLEAHVAVSDLSLPEGVTVTLPAVQTVAGVEGSAKEEPKEEGAEATEGAAASAS